MNPSPRRSRVKEAVGAGIWPALAIVLLIAVYPLLRYSGWWNAGGDALNFTHAIRTVLDAGELVPSGRGVYPNGYGFQALSVFLLNLGGIDLPGWQFYGGLLLITWTVFPAWLLYREWVGSNRGATLATIILFMQPEFLFGIMRGTHEKFTRGLILLCLYLLTYSIRSRHRPRRFAAALLAFYLATYALISFNNLFSTSYIAAVLLGFAMTWVLQRRIRPSPLLSIVKRRMAYVVVVSFILAFLYSFYVYDPAVRNLLTLKSIPDKIAALFLAFEKVPAVNPYAGPVFRAWINPYVYLLLTLANWLLLLGSGTIWVAQSVHWLRGRSRPSSDAELLQWAFYGAFALQGAVTILADVSGVLTSNLQHRIFPTISLVAAPLIARTLLTFLPAERQSVAPVLHKGLWLAAGLLFLLSLLKATNEPILSNQWPNYLPAEIGALDWAERALAERKVWTGYDRRLLEVIDIRSGAARRRVLLDRLEPEPETDNFLISDLMRLQVSRLGVNLPIASDDLVTFDNGQAQIYHRRPRTPYHR